MAKQRMTAEEKAAAREQQIRAAARARLAESFRFRRQRAAERRVLHVSEDGWPRWGEFEGDREVRAFSVLGAVLRRAFDARRDYLDNARRLADCAVENRQMLESGRTPWHRMAQRGAEFDVAREVYEARWETALLAADMAGVIVPEMDEAAYARHCAALAVRVEQPGPEVWRVEWPEGGGVESVAHLSEQDALAHAEEVYQRLVGGDR